MGPNQSCLLFEVLSKKLLIGKVFALCSMFKKMKQIEDQVGLVWRASMQKSWMEELVSALFVP